MYDVCGERERVELGGQVMAVRGCRQGTIRANGRILGNGSTWRRFSTRV